MSEFQQIAIKPFQDRAIQMVNIIFEPNMYGVVLDTVEGKCRKIFEIVTYHPVHDSQVQQLLPYLVFIFLSCHVKTTVFMQG